MSGTPELPTILVIDDNLEEPRGLQLELRDQAHLILSDPGEVEHGDIEGADLVLVDYTLDEWSQRAAATPLAQSPRHGLALAAVLRSQVDRRPEGQPIAFALYSGRIDDIAGSLPREVRDHVLARLNNLEWVFEKNAPQLAEQVLSLAHAVRGLPANWPANGQAASAQLRELLAMPAVDWADAAWRSVERCHPPLHELSAYACPVALDGPPDPPLPVLPLG